MMMLVWRAEINNVMIKVALLKFIMKGNFTMYGQSLDPSHKMV